MYKIFAYLRGFGAILTLTIYFPYHSVFILLFIISITIIYCCAKYSKKLKILFKLHKFYMGELLKLSSNVFNLLSN